jgi:general secretion pathway protein J
VSLKRKIPESGDAGFSLVEMLVALVLVGLAAMLMVQGLASGRRLWADEEIRTQRGETVEAAQTLVRARVERLRPVTRFGADRPYADLEGTPDTLSFISLPPDVERPSPMRRYRLFLDERGDLVLSSASALASPDAGGEAAADRTDQTLMRHVEGLAIDYFGPATRGAAPGWQPSWSQQPTPPQLVRIRLSFPAGDRRTWPDLIVAPATSLDTLCTLDPFTGVCRGRS